MAAAPQVGGYGTAGTAPYIYPRFLSAVEEYHPARDAWVTRPDSRSARYYLSAVGTAQGDVYAVGGYGVAATGAAATFNDFPLPGERTAAWCIAHVDRHHGGMEQHHALFKTLCKLQMSDWGVELHETLAGIIHTAACYDQLDLTNLAWVEMALRATQSIEFVYQERIIEKETLAAGSRLTLEERSAFTGAVRPGQQLMVCPSLLEHVKKEAERTGGLLKELRKAREEREARKGGKK